ncbi:hypothetical protein N0V93_000380 [Gnomoniopsis smithogilvyi]|uniref:Uncharacterized protein n=1 Tax=Gnomoniopsis smithogilvyi TaxID=1191159 RepID=A0A9W8YZJ8_9PEZI|nr:hypothetical protein N0V93_000380 [Gnomoniopsis smithogilvyi]
MPPATLLSTLPQLGNLLARNSTESLSISSTPVSQYLARQWRNPNDILSVLMLLGPDVVQTAVAQVAGRAVTPLAFSFGWAAYAFNALLATVGNGRLMPDATTPGSTLVIGAASGHIRTTYSWLLSKFLEDFNERIDREMEDEQAHPNPRDSKNTPLVPQSGLQKIVKPEWEALRVSVYEVDRSSPIAHGVPTLDWVWFSGVAVIIAQLILAMLPWVMDNDWVPFMIIASGNVLVLFGAWLPQWKEEKWSCPKNGGATVTVTQGNGSRNAIVILKSEGAGLDFEILAQGTRTLKPSAASRLVTAVLACLWVMLLVTVAGISQNTWWLLGIGLLGTIQNLVAAGSSRSPSALGLHLKHKETMRGASLAKVLKEVEERYLLVGSSLVNVFFPGSLRAKGDDLTFWQNAMKARMASNEYGSRVDVWDPLGS